MTALSRSIARGHTAVASSEKKVKSLGALGLSLAAALLGLTLTHPALIQVAMLVAVGPLVLALAMRSSGSLILVLAVWLVVMGTVRRLLLGSGSTALLGDPLLLIEPLVLLLLAAVAAGRGAFRNRTLLAKGVLGLNVLALIEAVNPLQGGLTVGLAGLLFILVPMLAFWVGRSLAGDQIMRRLLGLLAVLALPAAVYGLGQTYLGFPSWDEHWIQTSGYAALNVGGVIRAFASFSSAAEYASFLGVGIAIWFAVARRARAAPLALLAMALLGTALFLDSSRGIVVLAVAALGVMAAAMARIRMAAAAIWGIAALGVLFLIAAHAAPSGPASGPTAALVQHEIGGLTQPLNPQDSTLDGHFGELVSGLKSSFIHPIGYGTGAVTVAASKFGGAAQGTEVDPSNAGTALGILGLIAYLIVAVSGLATTYRVATARRDWLAIALLGVLAVTFFQWLNGGQYAVAWLPWLALGWADRAGRSDTSAPLPASFGDPSSRSTPGQPN